MTTLNSLGQSTNSAAGSQQSQINTKESNSKHKSDWEASSVADFFSSQMPATASQMPATAATAIAPTPLPAAVSVVKLTQAQVREFLVDETVKAMHAMVQDSFNRMQSCQKDPDQLKRGMFCANLFAKAIKQINTSQSLMLWEKMRSAGHFYIGLAPKEYFENMANSSAPFYKHINIFVLKKGVKASEALDAFIKGPSFPSSGDVCQIARFQAIRGFLKEKFDQLFANDGINPNPLKIGASDQLNPSSLLCTRGSLACAKGSKKGFQKGEVIAITGHRLYTTKHSNGDGGAYNLVCSEGGNSPKFLSFGLAPNMTQDQLSNQLCHAYNEDPLDDLIILNEEDAKAIYSTASKDQMLTMKKLAKHKVDIAQFKREGGGTIVKTDLAVFNLERVMLLATASIAQGRKLLQKWADERQQLLSGC